MNIPRFEGAIRAAGATQKMLAKEMNITQNTFSSKKKNGTFTLAEALWLCNRLSIVRSEDKCDIFLPVVSQ